MSQRVLLALGVLSIAASLLVGTLAMTTTGAALSMMGQFGASNGPTISIDKAQQSAQSFLDRRGNQDLRIDELMEFDQNFYALIKEKSSGVGAFELLVNKQTAVVSFEPGPDMMWNAKYGMMNRAGMMGFGSSTGAMTLSSDRATQVAQSWLDRQGGGNSAGTPDAFYGYYTFHFQKAGQITGMLSVNGSTGQVWLHTWHGRFIQARELSA